jgi:ubiquinone/menaquinone biosynthesis C-methylase UbiE
MTDPTQRFTTRVDDYVKARPGYPAELVGVLRSVGLTAPSVIADVGSGTGILTALLLEHGYEVFGVEPNRKMREAAESVLGGNPRFHSMDASAEQTLLPDACVDGITAAQAFHWFRKNETAREFHRILKPGGWAFLIWNSRKTDASPFMQAYEDLLQSFSVDYGKVTHRNVSDEEFRAFFGADGYRKLVLPNPHFYGLERLRSGMLSASYTPRPDDPRHEPMLRELESIFAANQCDGRVAYELDAEVYFGQL